MKTFQTLSWFAKDREEDGEHRAVMHIFGKAADGESVHVEVPYKLSYFIKGGGRHAIEKVHKALGSARKELVLDECRQTKRQDFVGFQNGRKDVFTEFVFTSLRSFFWAKRQLETFKRYESNVDPVLKFLHQTDLLPTGWVDVCDYE